MSEKVLLNSIMIVLFERKIISEEDLRKIMTAKDLARVLASKGVLDMDTIAKNYKELTSLVIRIKRMYQQKKLTVVEMEKLRPHYIPALHPFFDFVERSLCDKG